MVEFRVLGLIEVTDEGAPLDLGGAKAGALLAALLAHRGESISQGRLAEAIWPDSPSSRDTLQSYVSRVRRRLGPRGRPLLTRSGAGYQLEVAGRIDAHRFEEAVERGTDALAAGDPATALRVLEAGLDLWRGPAFAEFADDELVHAEACRLEELRMVACELRIDAQLALGRHGRVIGELEGLCEAHPLRERLWELRMLALARAGRQAEALRAYQQARVLVGEVGIEPSARLRRMEQAILSQDPTLERPTDVVRPRQPPHLEAEQASGAPIVQLPPYLTPFIGREQEISDVTQLLGGSRLVTLTGMGGVGKTRLAMEVAQRWATGAERAVGVVDVSGMVDPAEMEPEVAGCIRTIGGGAGRHTLVVIDNCEHLIERCAEVVAETLKAQPTLQILATSQEPLRLPAETRWRVEPMAVPEVGAQSAELLSNDAVRLFVERSLAIRPGLQIDDSAVEEISRISRTLDGIPLAIELAAALVATMGLTEIEQGLANRFELLREGYRGSPPRQQTLEGAFDWSFELLADDDRELLRQLRPFWTAFPRRAVEVVCANDPDEVSSLRASLRRLVDRSLVQMDDRSGEAVYAILPSIGQFLWERTGWQGELLEARAFVVSLAQHTEPRLRGPIEEIWAALFDGPIDVARAAMELTFDLHDLEAGCFLAGVVAARMTSSGRIGFVGGVRSSPIARFEVGLRAGAGWVSDDIEVDAVYLSAFPDFSGFHDLASSRAATTEMFQRGTDVVLHAAGSTGGQGVFEAARSWHATSGEHRWVIGVDVDERVTRDASLQAFALTSVRRQIPTAVYAQIKAAVAVGEPDRAPTLDLANEGVGLSTTGGDIDHLTAELAAVRLGVIAGEIDVPRAEPAHGSRWSDPSEA